MIISQYVKFKYKNEFNIHNIDHCTCDLTEGGKGLCIFGQYIEGNINEKELLETLKSKYSDLRYGTYIRTRFGDVARIINIVLHDDKVFFKLDREVRNNKETIDLKSNFILDNDINIDIVSNELKEIVKVGDIVNGHKIIMIKEEKLYYGYWKNEYIQGDVEELLTSNDYNTNTIFSR